MTCVMCVCVITSAVSGGLLCFFNPLCGAVIWSGQPSVPDVPVVLCESSARRGAIVRLRECAERREERWCPGAVQTAWAVPASRISGTVISCAAEI